MGKKFSLEERIIQAREVHGDKYDYSLITNYKNDKIKYPIICPEHGIFYKSFNKHIKGGQGCPKCSGKFRYNTDTFIEKAKLLEHCKNYTFEKTEFVSTKQNVIITCHEKDENGKEHGDFEITPCHLFDGQGCPICRYIKSANSKRRPLEKVIELAQEVHENKYDYSLITDYKNDRIKYPIICPEHGVFEQTMNNHINGKQGCPKCGDENRHLNNRNNEEKILQKLKIIHGDKYDYSKFKYITANQKATIICPKHGEFQQKISSHLMGQGCKFCAIESIAKKRSLTQEEFIEKAREVHGDKYDYSKVEYINENNKICIICPEHGEFIQLPYNHLQGNGCPKCFSLVSKYEEELIAFISNLVGKENVILRDRKILNGRELDIYLPEYNLAFEVDGIYWHNELKKDKNYHLDKTIECEKHGIHLFHIFEDELAYKQDIIKSMIINMINQTKITIYARKCEIKEVSATESSSFLNKNHLQGKCNSLIKLGLYYNNELVSLMTFGKSRHFIGNGKIQWELLRFCNKLNTSVIGGASKLLKYFIDNYKPDEIISYADRRWSNGNLYDKLKFKFDHYSKPNYYYVVGRKRQYRFNLRKSILVQKYGCPENVSEHEFCLSKNWYRIYDCGCLCYIWKK